MSDLKPLGSERLQGDEKIRRILEIARYKEVPKQVVNELSSVEYSKTLSDGVKYVIAKEKLGYIIKKSINEGVEEYIEPMKNRKYYNSYSQALKRLNLLAREVNYVQGVNEGIDLFNEQKKYTLKTPKPPVSEPTYDEPAPDMSMDTGVKAEMDLDMGTEPTTDTGSEMDMDLTADLDMGTEEPTSDMGSMDMGSMDMGKEDAVDFKTIQKITGKLSQKLRSFDKNQGLDSQDIKYVLNSIISAIDLDNLDEDDKEDILDKLDSFDEDSYDMGDEDLDVDPEDEFDAELGDMGSDEEMPSDEMDMEPTPAEEKEGYHHMMDSVFGESKVEKVLSKYFKIDEKEKTILEEKRKRNFLKEKLKKLNVKEEIISMSESLEQKVSALYVLKENKDAKFIGKTNKENLVFNIDGKQVKVTPRGRIIWNLFM